MERERPAPIGEVPVVEIPLAGDGAPAAQPDGPTRAPNWRRLTGLSALAGVLVGIVVAVVVAGGSDDEESTPTTLDPDELASAITVPPTLTPVTEPPVTLPPVPGQPASDAPPADAALVAESVETLPPITGTVPQPDTFRLSDGSLAALDAPLARRSVTDYVVGVDGFEQTVTITNDPTTGRYLLEFDYGGEIEPVIIDLLGGLTYVRTELDGVGQWTTIPNDQVAANTGSPDMATFVRNLQLGPVRSDTRDAWEVVRPNGLVESSGPDDLLEWIVVLDADAVPEWARYAFGPGAEAAPLPGNTKVGYAVYVGRDGSIRRVSGSSEFGVTTQRIVHRIEELDEPPVIELPTVAAPTDVSTTTDPTTDPGSTSTASTVSEP